MVYLEKSYRASEAEHKFVSERSFTGALEDAQAYRLLADHIIDQINPPDGDGSEESILMDAVEGLVAYVRDQPCLCGRLPDEESSEESCDRCRALGLYRNVQLER